MNRPAQEIFDHSLARLRRNRTLRHIKSPGFLGKLVADEMADRVSAINRTFETAVIHNDHGGALAQTLAAIGKIEWGAHSDPAQQSLPATGARVVSDEEALPFGPGTLALYVSALSLNYANDLPGALVQIRRALRPDGLLMAAVLGGDSLMELRQAFLAAESELTTGASPRVAPFADIRDLGTLLQRAGFALPVVDADRLTVRYDTALDLMNDLKTMALTSALASRSRTPTSRGLLVRASEIYRAKYAHEDDRIPATFHIIYMAGWAPHESQQKPLRPGSAKQRLADALGTDERKL